MNSLQIFNFEESEVRTVVIDSKPHFMGNDVSQILGYKDLDKAIRQHVDEEDKRTLSYRASAKMAPSLWKGNDYSHKTLINESGLYALIFSSKLESAKKFKRWVTSEVLPQIRKQGMYMTSTLAQEITNNPEIIHYLAEQVAKINTSNNKYHEETSSKLETIDRKIEGEYATPQDIDAIKYATKVKAEKFIDKLGMQLTIDSVMTGVSDIYEMAQINKRQKQQYRHDLGKMKSRILVETKKQLGMKGNSPNNHIKRKDIDLAIQIINDMRVNEIYG